MIADDGHFNLQAGSQSWAQKYAIGCNRESSYWRDSFIIALFALNTSAIIANVNL